MSRKSDCRLERFGANLPAFLLKPAVALWHPLLFDWVVTLFSLGYSLTVLFMGASALHLGIYRGPLVESFTPYTLGFAATMFVASVLGLFGLARLSKSMRMKSSFFLVMAYAWVAMYYYNAIPLPWQAVFLYGFHAATEVAVYWRCATDPRHLWERPSE